jgi:hypothetical protein
VTVQRLACIAFVFLGLAVGAAENAATPAAGVKIGDRIDRLSFKDIRFVTRTLKHFGEQGAYVLVFLGTTCPVAGRYAPVLNAIQTDYGKRGVQLIGVNASPDDTLLEMAADAIERKLAFPVHKDFDQSAMDALGVTRTPEVAVLDGERRLRYRGRIDEQHLVSGVSPSPGRAYLREALDAVLAGRAPEVTETPVEGCVITRRRPPERKDVTYAEHILPLLQKHCQECHRPEQPAPFTLLTYEDAAARAAMIREVVEERRMPPCYSDARFGPFANRRELAADEIELFSAWTAAGAPRGDPARASQAIEWPGTPWLIGEPDLVLEIPQEFAVPSAGLVKYQYPVLDHVFEHDTWVSAIQILPSNRRVVHHANLYILQPPPLDRVPTFLTGHVPGGEVTKYGKNAGILIPAGSRLRLQIHYVTTGKEETDRTRVGIVFARERIERRVKVLMAINHQFAIPPLDPAHEMRAQAELPDEALGVGIYVHMHVRGKDMTFHAAYPDGTRETLLSVPNYSFDWQMSYRWPGEGKRFPAGTRIETVSHYDNSIFNPFNPDPTATVREGQQTHQEMNYGFLFYVDTGEKLQIEVDPKTGRPLAPASVRL